MPGVYDTKNPPRVTYRSAGANRERGASIGRDERQEIYELRRGEFGAPASLGEILLGSIHIFGRLSRINIFVLRAFF